MLCPQCQTSNSIDYNFCRECGGGLGASATTGDPHVEKLLARAFMHLDRESFDEARDAALAVLALEPKNASANSVLGLAYERQGKADEAIRAYEAVLAVNPGSKADRIKLEALRAERTTTFRRPRWTASQITWASAVAAGVLVFLCGGAIVSHLAKQEQASSVKGTGAAIRPVSSPTMSASTSVDDRRRIMPLPTPPTPLTAGTSPQANPLIGPPAPRTAATPVMPVTPATPTTPRSLGRLRPSAPLGPLSVPNSVASAENGLAPAGIGEVVPIPQVPATAPAAPISTAIATAPASAPAAPAGPQSRPGGVATAEHTEDSANAPAPRELREPETGFIRIEPIGTGQPKGADGQALTAPKGPPPTISLNFSGGDGSEAILEDAQRARRSAQAAKQTNAAEAQRQYRQAISLYEILVRRGGSTARPAREALEECKKALASLR